MLESYSADARRAVVLATTEARRLGHPRVGTEHLLLGLLADGDAPAAHTLNAAGATLAAARHKVAEVIGPDPGQVPAGERQFTPRAQRALERAGRFSRQDREPDMSATHLLLGVLDVEGLACQVLRGLGVDLARLHDELTGRPVETAPEPDPEPKSEPGPDPQPAPIATRRPRCPACAAPLDDGLTVTTIAARRDGGDATPVEVVACGACGTALGALAPHH